MQSVKIVKESERRKKNPIKGRRKSGSPHKKCEKIALKRAKIVSNRQILRLCAWNRNVGTPNRKFPKLATAVVTQKEGKNAEQKLDFGERERAEVGCGADSGEREQDSMVPEGGHGTRIRRKV